MVTTTPSRAIQQEMQQVKHASERKFADVASTPCNNGTSCISSGNRSTGGRDSYSSGSKNGGSMDCSSRNTISTGSRRTSGSNTSSSCYSGDRPKRKKEEKGGVS
mmetsp:Transcript_26093/g.36449  ORF Transcript_26093/g.36449 Transcript_26093/m.36449 type:complete len:105 (+) Transcript_26093:413-727(+)